MPTGEIVPAAVAEQVSARGRFAEAGHGGLIPYFFFVFFCAGLFPQHHNSYEVKRNERRAQARPGRRLGLTNLRSALRHDEEAARPRAPVNSWGRALRAQQTKATHACREDAQARADPGSARKSSRVSHVAWSWAAAYAADWEGGTVRRCRACGAAQNQEQQPCGLEVRQLRELGKQAPGSLVSKPLALKSTLESPRSLVRPGELLCGRPASPRHCRVRTRCGVGTNHRPSVNIGWPKSTRTDRPRRPPGNYLIGAREAATRPTCCATARARGPPCTALCLEDAMANALAVPPQADCRA